MQKSMKSLGRLKKEHVDLVAETVQRLERENGKARAHDLLALARPASSPLHALFEWNDTEAAERWRLHQARVFIRAVTVVYSEGDVEKWSAPAFVSVQTAAEDEEGKSIRDRGYMSVEKALADPVTRQQLLDEALQQADYWRRKHRNLSELAPVFSAIEKTRSKVRGRKMQRA